MATLPKGPPPPPPKPKPDDRIIKEGWRPDKPTTRPDVPPPKPPPGPKRED